MSTSSGFYVAVNNNTEDLMTDYSGNVVSVGSDNYISIRKHKYVRLDEPYSNCTDQITLNATTEDQEVLRETLKYNKRYHFNYCNEICIQKHFILKNCSCQDPSIKLFKTTLAICHKVEQLACVTNLRKDWQVEQVSRVCNGICPTNCETYEYIPTLSAASYPTEFYTATLNQTDKIKGKQADNRDVLSSLFSTKGGL